MLTLIAMAGVLARLDLTLALVSVVVVPFMYLSLRLYTERIQAGAERAKELESALVSRVYENLSSIRIVKTFAREEQKVERFSEAATAAMRARTAVVHHDSRFSFLVGAITVAGSCTVLGVGALHVLNGTLSIGTLLVVMA